MKLFIIIIAFFAFGGSAWKSYVTAKLQEEFRVEQIREIINKETKDIISDMEEIERAMLTIGCLLRDRKKAFNYLIPNRSNYILDTASVVRSCENITGWVNKYNEQMQDQIGSLCIKISNLSKKKVFRTEENQMVLLE